MSFFSIHSSILSEYQAYIRSFLSIKDARIREKVEDELNNGLLWPEPLIQFNPSFKYGKSIRELCRERVLHSELDYVFPGFKLYPVSYTHLRRRRCLVMIDYTRSE